LNIPVADPFITKKQISKDTNNDVKINRKCKSCQEEEEDSEDLKISRKENGDLTNSTTVSRSTITGIDNTLSKPGNPLDLSTREFMEPRFGHDFGKVKIYANDNAAKSAESINARAFTLDNNIVFGRGQYNPSNDDGKKLLAHELTHVIQKTQERKSNIG